ncbi:hypothetical protein PHYBOEH_002427 [Phytophthora boehmeriae]|uniref:Uncharacterized protein n=1 Tax=Phytophthora boehmeriae TaxID=109152 RepID=A0A8T1XB28_9STRA|nr:hypothetical protein PHYBOEH_002427 [Phytophthora boehmeriae]
MEGTASAADFDALAFDFRVRLWRVEAALTVRKFLSLGHAYEVHYSVPQASDGESNALQASDFGLQVNSLMGSHVFQVDKVLSEQLQFPMQFVDKVARKTSCEPIYTIQPDDYLVGMDKDDFLVCPRKLKQLNQDIAALSSSGVPGKKVVVLRFVRLEKPGQGTPLQRHSPGQILRTLDDIDNSLQYSVKKYEELIKSDRVAVQRLHSAKKILQYVKIMTCDTRNTLMEDRKISFADKFRQWYTAIIDPQQKERGAGGNDGATNGEARTGQPVEEMIVDMGAKPAANGAARTPRKRGILIASSSVASSHPATPKKRVRFALVLEQFDVPAAASVPTQATASPQFRKEQQAEMKVAPKPRTLHVEESRAYLLALFGPNADLVSSLEQLIVAVRSMSSLSKMSHEFKLTPDVKLWRELRVVGPSRYTARVRLGHLRCDCTASDESEATTTAIDRLTKDVAEHRRLYGGLLAYLKNHYGFSAENDNRKVKDAVFSYLVSAKIVRLHEIKQEGVVNPDTFDVVAFIQDLPLIWKRESSITDARSIACCY